MNVAKPDQYHFTNKVVDDYHEPPDEGYQLPVRRDIELGSVVFRAGGFGAPGNLFEFHAYFP